ncbi:glycoside hydrolase family 1 protein [Pediococcus cellicola]|uniref:Aryl-phospho-beta-d-glucosidase n=1 Tax=Pediococcus cellicola TaxID=319652 RepID=A0A0R2ITT9_9LACO|nr:glycoside hydrolase family 1 protein [Pediococcus cellicola]KRN66293.1 aryl-phospho-beta-d-glucosidase [Pediococcus cellicola]GEL15137.1 glycosyl hydrolase [Pediococcus cellicola]
MMTKDNFRWGVSSSAFQIEGASKSDGKGPSTLDKRLVKSGIADTSVASDFYHHWHEDIKLLELLGVTSFRMSISWSRIFPSGVGSPNKAGVDFYDQVIDDLLMHNIEPVITINHFDMPYALINKFNGWLSRDSVSAFTNYAKFLFVHYGNRVKTWLTINEPLMLMYNPAFNGSRYNNPKRSTKSNFQILHHILLAEKNAMRLCHELVIDGEIGPVAAFENVYPTSSNPNDVDAALTAESILSYWALDVAIKGKYPGITYNELTKINLAPKVSAADDVIFKSAYPDFIAYNYYSSIRVSAHHQSDNTVIPFFDSPLFSVDMGTERKTDKWSAMEADPIGMGISARKLYERYHLPLMITENGYADTEIPNQNGEIQDDQRIEYLSAHISICKKLVDEGIPLKGYFIWSFLDSLSGREGFSKRYGLVYVNRTDTDIRDLRRIPKKSFYWYRNLIREWKA